MDKQNKSAELPELIYSVEYAGTYEIQAGPYYEDINLLDVEYNDYAEEFSNELVRRYNTHEELTSKLTTLQQANAELEQVVSERAAECIKSGMKIVELEKQNAELKKEIENYLVSKNSEIVRLESIIEEYKLRDSVKKIQKPHESNKQP